MKIKNRVIGTVFGVIASLFVFISVSESANAEECSATDPCQTYAMLDSSDNVINIIVCQPSVCGGGTWAGYRVVLQVAANPQTNDTSGTGGYMTKPQDNQIVTFSQDNVFTVKKDDVIVQTIIKPEVEVNNTNNTTTSMQAQFIDTSSVRIDVTQTTNSTTINNSSTVEENIFFQERKTAEEVYSVLIEQKLVLMQSKINKLLIILGSWLL